MDSTLETVVRLRIPITSEIDFDEEFTGSIHDLVVCMPQRSARELLDSLERAVALLDLC